MNHRRRIRYGAMVAALCLLLGACGSGGGGGDSDSGPSGEPQSGGTLRLIMPTDGQDLDPATSSVAATAFGDQILPIFDTLVRVDQDGNITPRIATEVVTSDEGTTWTITLREGVEFSDGTSLDSAALKFNWERYAQDASPLTSDAKSIAAMSVVDPVTLEVSLARPNAGFPFLLQGPLGMIGSPTAIQEMGDQYPVAPVGAGPFILEERNPGAAYTYSRNPNYWDAPRPYADSLEIRIIPEAQQMVSSFRAGEADVIHGSSDAALWRQLEKERFRVLAPEVFGGTVIWFNNIKEPTDDARVRRALVMAMDPDVANDKVEEGAAAVVLNLFPMDSPYYVPEAEVPWNGDLEEAQSLIDEYVADNGGTPLTIVWTTIEGAFGRWAEAFAQQINQNLDNIDVKLESVSPQEALEGMYDASFDLTAGSLIALDPAQEMSGRLMCDSGRNFANYCNPDMDAALERALQSTDRGTRIEALTHAQEILWKDIPFFFQQRSIMYTAMSDNIGGLEDFSTGLLTLESAWLAQ